MSLSNLFEKLDNLITNKRPVSDIKPVLTLLRDQAEALENDHAALKEAHTKLQEAHTKLQSEKSEIDKEFARLKAAKANEAPNQEDDFNMEGLGDF